MNNLIKIADIKPHPDNPKEHPEEQLDKIAETIKALGWGRGILLSKDNYILAGHGAVLAAETRLRIKEVPYNRSEHNHDTNEAIALMEADNKLSELSLWDYNKLELNHEKLRLEGFDLKLTGFNEIELNENKNHISEDNSNYELPEEEPEYDESIVDTVKFIKCPECGHEFPE